jgi:hypothetical protein
MLKRAVRALTAAVVIAVSAAGSASASGFDTNHGKRPIRAAALPPSPMAGPRPGSSRTFKVEVGCRWSVESRVRNFWWRRPCTS